MCEKRRKERHVKKTWANEIPSENDNGKKSWREGEGGGRDGGARRNG